MPPLRGVFHAAGIVADGVLIQQDWPRFLAAMAPKLDGAWNLHVMTRKMPLDFFVCFSSVASILGSSGQGNYAAANAFLDGLAHQRRIDGLPGLTVNWGAWDNTGMTAAIDAGDRRRIDDRGQRPMTPDQALAVFGQALAHPRAQLTIGAFDWRSMQSWGHAERPLLDELVRKLDGPVAEASRSAPPDLVQQLAAAPRSTRRGVLLGSLRAQVIGVLGLPRDYQIVPRQPLNELGLDSLTAVELRNVLAQRLGCSLPATLLFDYPTLDALADYLLDDVLDLPADEREANGSSHHAPDERSLAIAELEQISEEIAEELLLAELASLQERTYR
jgi:acyl carrier protein